MTPLDFLESLKTFLAENVAAKITLQSEGSDPIEYVNPYVEIVYLPHKNFTPYSFQVPYMMVSLDEGADEAQEHQVDIRINCATYGGGFYLDEDGEPTKIPDAQGYKDLLNLMEFIRQALLNSPIIGGKGRVLKPVTYGMYDTELVWPYWYGHLSFSVSLLATEYDWRDIDDL